MGLALLGLHGTCCRVCCGAGLRGCQRLLTPSPISSRTLKQSSRLSWRGMSTRLGSASPTIGRRKSSWLAMAPRLAGYTLAGAGGGGFVLLVTKEPNDKEGLQAALDSIVHTFSLHECEVDSEGMMTKIDDGP